MATEMLKPVEWVGSSREDLKKFPAIVQDRVGFALYQAQVGLKHRSAKPHAFQKKAKRGTATPKQEIDLVKHRLKAAEQHYADTYGEG